MWDFFHFTFLKTTITISVLLTRFHFYLAFNTFCIFGLPFEFLVIEIMPQAMNDCSQLLVFLRDCFNFVRQLRNNHIIFRFVELLMRNAYFFKIMGRFGFFYRSFAFFSIRLFYFFKPFMMILLNI